MKKIKKELMFQVSSAAHDLRSPQLSSEEMPNSYNPPSKHLKQWNV
ncbi:MAG: hypothetical protein ACLRZG_11120 [Streptococcus sp.]